MVWNASSKSPAGEVDVRVELKDALLEQIDQAAKLEGENRSEYILEAVRMRMAQVSSVAPVPKAPSTAARIAAAVPGVTLASNLDAKYDRPAHVPGCRCMMCNQ